MNTASERSESADAGFTLVEVMVAMLLLAVLALAILPTFVAQLRATSVNTTIATASQLAGQQIDDAQSRAATCAALQAYQSETVAPVVDARGIALQATRTVSLPCPTTYPATISVTVTVAASGSATILASVTSLVLLRSAS
ncbi:prepilin-type N-terminal cleavage/methylation domain-containing protein [Leifsonia sp. AG29]|uniref:prepilin-type N-terminal cleavage/methylation domain-containing protein n=1 Tax=Leifsonia sp. AG29 TaxID=2598860 RepID=UPI00131BDE5E|nr:prepilin-type N-terminal cleavage/methylation domain-containing protein [Leifsonia sp. AG29]